MMFDRTLLFFNNKNVAAATGDTVGRVVDFRLDGQDIDGKLSVYVCAVGAAPSKAVTTIIETSDTGTSGWTQLASQASVGNVLFKGKFPTANRKRFVRATVKVTEALSGAVKVFGGIVAGDFDETDFGKLQAFPPLEDVAKTALDETL